MATELVPVEARALTLSEQARAMTVTDQVTHDIATELYLGLSQLEKEISAIHDPAIKAAHDSHKAAIAAKAKLAGPVEEAKRIIKPKITAWEAEQERIRRELEEKALEEARKREEAERLAMAVHAEQLGAPAEYVEEVLSTPQEIQRPIVAPTFQKTKGFSSRENWSARVTDIRLLCKEIAEGRQPANLVDGNMTVLNGLARSLKSALKIPGVQAVKTIV